MPRVMMALIMMLLIITLYIIMLPIETTVISIIHIVWMILMIQI